MKYYKIVEHDQGSAQWLAWRRSKITASMSAVIMGLSPWETPLQLFNKILSSEETPDNERMAHGRNTESEARGWTIHQTGTAYHPVCMESIAHPWLACSLDGWNANSDVKAVEIKCPMKTVDQLNSMVDIPVNYFCQMQHQMAVSGIDKIYYVTYSRSSQDGVIITVKRDDLFIEKMIPQLKTFWDRLASFDPPDPIDGRDIIEINDPEARNEAIYYMLACNEVQIAEMKKERMRKLLIDRAAGRNVKIDELKIMKVISKGRINYTAVKELQGIDLETYRKPATTSWRFS